MNALYLNYWKCSNNLWRVYNISLCGTCISPGYYPHHRHDLRGQRHLCKTHLLCYLSHSSLMFIIPTIGQGESIQYIQLITQGVNAKGFYQLLYIIAFRTLMLSPLKLYMHQYFHLKWFAIY